MRKPGLTYANVMSTVAVFLALGGVSWAATSLPRDSVGTQQLKRDAVTATDVKSGAITSAKVKDRSLLAKDFKAGQLPKGATGPAGPKGDSGPQGATGTQGVQGPAGPAVPTEAVYGSLGAVTFAPDTIVAVFPDKTTTTAGRLAVSVTIDRNIVCPTFRAVITVDDAQVPGSLRRVLTADNPDLFTLQGVTLGSVAAGSHSVKVIGDCELGDATLGATQFASYVATVLGA
jgi:hypothetical protein